MVEEMDVQSGIPVAHKAMRRAAACAALGALAVGAFPGLPIPEACRLALATYAAVCAMMLARIVGAEIEIEATARGASFALAILTAIRLAQSWREIAMFAHGAFAATLTIAVAVALIYCWLTVGRRSRIRLMNVITLHALRRTGHAEVRHVANGGGR